MNPSFFAIGAMSGTSMDGIDVALLETDGIHHVRPIDHLHLAYPPPFHALLKSLEYGAQKTKGNLKALLAQYPTLLETFLSEHPYLDQSDMAEYLYGKKERPILAHDIIAHSTQLHIELVQALRDKHPYPIRVIGYHGQTLYHDPKRLSLQVGHPATMATALDLPVVFDFRQKDIEQGGQGAPLAPLYHQALAHTQGLPLPLAIINCGGIANITCLSGLDPHAMVAFDTGPGNCLLDGYMKKHTKGQMHYDQDGRIGLRGQIDTGLLHDVLHQCFKDPSYRLKRGPKSLDRHDIIPPNLDKIAPETALRTLAHLTAYTIIEGLEDHPKAPMHHLLVGGGWKNPCILSSFKKLLKEKYPMDQIVHHHLNPQAIEAELFAYLAIRHLDQRPTTYPNLTGGFAPVVTGEQFSS